LEDAMTVMTSSTFDASSGLIGRHFHSLVAALRARLGHLMRAYRNRSEAAALTRFDERDLADIGLTRGDVRDAFAGPLWQDPTSLLRARALERRLSRHGISFGLQETAPAPPLVPDFTRLPTNRPARFTV
jgi:uncharacterized protein YjiS (DUF1127 family)